MLVAASTDCFCQLSLEGALERLVELEYSTVEIDLAEQGRQLRPSQVLSETERAIAECRDVFRLSVCAYSFDSDAPEPVYYDQFAACCKLAKATKVVTLTVPAGELGTPFNAEIERLRKLVSIAAQEGVVVGVLTQLGRITQDPDTAAVLCDNVKGLGITLDPSQFIYQRPQPVHYEQLLKHVIHVRLRDTTREQLQVRVGQGLVEYGKLLAQLAKFNYNRALAVHIREVEGVDHAGELRKMRLLLESLL